MQKVIIFGITDLAEVLIDHLERDDKMYEVSAITVDRRFLPTSRPDQRGGEKIYPLVPFEEIEEVFSPDEYAFFICIGYKNMNEGRRRETMKRHYFKFSSFEDIAKKYEEKKEEKTTE